METLTKDNFWNEMEQKYPKAMAHFKEWVDKYKSEHDWEELFGNYGACTDNNYTVIEVPKYHELPIAMQFGIFINYLYSWANGLNYTGMQNMIGNTMTSPNFIQGVKDCISCLLSMMEDCPA